MQQEWQSTAMLIRLGKKKTKGCSLLLESFEGFFVCFLSLLVTSGPPDSSLQVWQVSAEDSGKGTCF